MADRRENVLDEAAIVDEYNALHAVGDLPTRGLLACVVWEAGSDGTEVVRDLECLDEEDPPRLVAMGQLVKLSDEGQPLLSTSPNEGELEGGICAGGEWTNAPTPHSHRSVSCPG